MKDLEAELQRAIKDAADQYFRLVILAGESGSGKSTVLLSVANAVGCRPVNVTLELSKRMLELTRTQRSRQVGPLLKEVIAAVSTDVVFLDNLEILFDTSLDVDQLRLLQVCSRHRTIVTSWNGSYIAGTLTYAEPGHPEFVQFKQTEAVIVSMEGNAQELRKSTSP